MSPTSKRALENRFSRRRPALTTLSLKSTQVTLLEREASSSASTPSPEATSSTSPSSSSCSTARAVASQVRPGE